MVAAGYDTEYVAFVTPRLPALRRLAYLLVGDWHRADDLVQATMVALYVQWRRVRVTRDMDPYVRAMLVKQFLTERRRAWSRVWLTARPLEPRPPQHAGDPEDRALLRAALEQLPKRQRAVLVLRFLCDQSVADTAEALRCSPGTVKSQTSHGLATLRRLLGTRSLAALRT